MTEQFSQKQSWSKPIGELNNDDHPQIKHIFNLPSATIERCHKGGMVFLREVFNKKLLESGFNFLHYSLIPPGSTIGTHQHINNEEIYIILEGQGLMFLNEQPFNIKAGDAILTKHGDTHALVNNSESDISILVVEAAYNSLSGFTIEDQQRQIITLKTVENLFYPVVQSFDIFDLSNEILSQAIENRSFLLFVSSTVEHLYGNKIRNYIAEKFSYNQGKLVVIPTSEHNKNIDNVTYVCEKAKEFGLDRKGLFIAVGGGILLDIVSFAASLFRRRTDCIKIGTTLIGQIDAAIGVKCGVNFKGTKNLLGAFYPPRLVITDTNFLLTLAERHIRCGLAEIIKLAIIKDKILFNLVEKYYELFLTRQFHTSAIEEILQISLLGMLEELASNLYETNLKRLVDFGHTFSPSIETESNFTIFHGEAVSIDMALTCVTANRLGYLSDFELEQVLALLQKLGLPIYHNLLEPKMLYDSLHNAYLHRGKKLNMPIPISIGAALFIEDISVFSLSLLQETVNFLKIRNDLSIYFPYPRQDEH